jgi:hypothetical protein
MSKRRQKTESVIHATSAATEGAVDAALYEQLYEMIPRSVIIHATSAATEGAVHAALYEQLYEMIGRVEFARHLAARLRDPSPHRTVLDAVARMLDPEGDDCFQVVVRRRRGGKSPTKHVKDAALAKAIVEQEQEGRPKHGERKGADGKIADQFNISESKVRQVRGRLRTSK